MGVQRIRVERLVQQRAEVEPAKLRDQCCAARHGGSRVSQRSCQPEQQPAQEALQPARAADIAIGYYSVVYDVLEEIEGKLQKVLSPTPDGELVGTAVVKQCFDLSLIHI